MYVEEAMLLHQRHGVLIARLTGMRGHASSDCIAFGRVVYEIELHQNKVRKGLGMVDRSKAKKIKWKGFANIDIPDSQRERARTYIFEGDAVETDLQTMIADNYKITMSQNEVSGSVTCTATCNNEQSMNAGYSLSGYGKDWLCACGSLLFKHFKIADCDWEGFTRGEDSEFS